MAENIKKSLTFKVKSFRRIPNPYENLKVGDKAPNMAVAICDVKDIPDCFPMGTNPREQKLTTNVAKKIQDSLLSTTELNFYLLNRGILLSAQNVTFNGYSNEITLTFEDDEVHGNVDGGHTYKTILKNRDDLEEGQQFVKIEILTGIENIFQSLAAARNTSVQVQDKSIAELENRFEIIKDNLSKEEFVKNIYFKENEQGEIDVADILAILNLFNIDRYKGKDTCPINSYSSKKKCIDLYIAEHKKLATELENPYVKMSKIMPDIFRLYDLIECQMEAYYRIKNPNGKYGSVKGVQLSRKGHQLTSKFFKKNIDIASPSGFIYPILGAFRALLEEKEGKYIWKKNPFDVAEKLGPELVESTVNMSRSLGNNPNAVGKDSNIWKQLYMTVAFEALS